MRLFFSALLINLLLQPLFCMESESGFLKSSAIFSIILPDDDFNNYANNKIDSISTAQIYFNDSLLTLREIELRGKSTLQYKRKSFNIELEHAICLATSDTTCKLNDFALISMNMDQHYYRNRLAYGLLSELQIFNLHYQYVNVYVNEVNYGIYLLVERPHKFAMHKEKAGCVIRRGYNGQIDYTKSDNRWARYAVMHYQQDFKLLYELVDSLEGRKLLRALEKRLDLDQYMKFMAFNFLLGNGDYTDEIFFYVDHDNFEKRFKIIPWDFDDLFMKFPHEGALQYNSRTDDKLVFSIEDKIDRKILEDPVLYYRYKKVLAEVIQCFEKLDIERVLSTIYDELTPYYSNEEVIKNACYDRYGETDLRKLKLDMQQNLLFISNRMNHANKIIHAR